MLITSPVLQKEKEMLFIAFAIDRFYTYVYGRAITVETDHNPLFAIVKKPFTSAPIKTAAYAIAAAEV